MRVLSNITKRPLVAVVMLGLLLSFSTGCYKKELDEAKAQLQQKQKQVKTLEAKAKSLEEELAKYKPKDQEPDKKEKAQ